MNEQWKAVKGFEGSYEVSNRGKVRSLDRTIDGGRYGTMRLRGINLKLDTQSLTVRISLSRGGLNYNFAVYDLVKQAFGTIDVKVAAALGAPASQLQQLLFPSLDVAPAPAKRRSVKPKPLTFIEKARAFMGKLIGIGLPEMRSGA